MKTEDYRASLLKRLADPEYSVGFLTEVLANETPEAFLIAIKDVIDARKENISSFSGKSGITRQGFYQALSKTGNPRFSTITQVLDALGLRLAVAKKVAA